MKLPLISLLALFSINVSAVGLEAETKQFCAKIKTCTLAQIQTEQVPPEMEAMLTPMIDKMCQEMMASVAEADTQKGAEAEAAACMTSMTALSCDAIMSGKAETTECQALEAKSSQAD